MPINKNFLAPFQEDGFFHVYNRTNGSHKLFRNEENYRFFLETFEEYLKDILDLYAYCLMPSHFHFILRVRKLFEITDFLGMSKIEIRDINEILVKQFKAFFISYTMAFNKFYKRQGSLFNHRFRRAQIESVEDLKDRIFYVHSNPVHHSLTKEFINYNWSSYPLILSDEPTIIKRSEVLNLYGGKEAFIQYHESHKAVIAKPHV